MEAYAGFWKRFLAYIIDGIIIYCAQGFIIVPILAAVGLNIASQVTAADAETMNPDDMMGIMMTAIATASSLALISYSIAVIYSTAMEGSKFQATVGKMALGIKVTDMNGGKLDFGKALVRNLCKVISAMIIYIGFIMAGFTEKKQGLHDIIAGTLVVNKSATAPTPA